MELYKKTVQKPGAWFAWKWWEQEGIYLLGARARAAAAADREEEREGEETALGDGGFGTEDRG